MLKKIQENIPGKGLDAQGTLLDCFLEESEETDPGQPRGGSFRISFSFDKTNPFGSGVLQMLRIQSFERLRAPWHYKYNLNFTGAN